MDFLADLGVNRLMFRPPRLRRRLAWAGVVIGGGLFAASATLIATRARPERATIAAQPFDVVVWACAAIVPSMLALGVGWANLRGPRRVTIVATGIEIVGLRRRAVFAWSEVDAVLWRMRPLLRGGREPALHLVGRDGDDLAIVPATLEHFWLLAIVLGNRFAREGEPWPADERDPRVLARAAVDAGRRRRWGAASGALMASGAAAAFAWGAFEMGKDAGFATPDGATVAARLERTFVLGSTPWVRYAFDDPRGRTFARETTMHRAEWERVRGSRTIDVEYLRSDPSWSRLRAGESSPTFGVGWLLGSGAFFLVTSAAATFLCLGLDITVGEGEPGARLTRHGRAVWRSKANAAYAAQASRDGGSGVDE